jgi:hypothetical protein
MQQKWRRSREEHQVVAFNGRFAVFDYDCAFWQVVCCGEGLGEGVNSLLSIDGLLFSNTIVHFDKYIVGWPVSGKASIPRSQWTICCFRTQSCILAGGLQRGRVPGDQRKTSEICRKSLSLAMVLETKSNVHFDPTRRRVHEMKKISRHQRRCRVWAASRLESGEKHSGEFRKALCGAYTSD